MAAMLAVQTIFIVYFLIPIFPIQLIYEGIRNEQYLPRNQYEHFLIRDAMLKAERKFEQRDWILSEDEKIADHYLAYLKFLEFKNSKDLGFPPAKPIEKVINNIVNSELYQTLINLPKGGILHSHEDHQLSRTTLFDIIWKSEDFDHLYIIDPNSFNKSAWKMDFFVNPPTSESWIKVKESGLSKEEILKQNTLIGLLTPEATNNPTDSHLRWSLVNPLWSRSSVQLISNINIKNKYIPAMLEHCYNEGISYIESRRGFGLDLPLYFLDHSGSNSETNGKKFFNLDEEINFSKELVRNFSTTHPRFIGHKWISYASRASDPKSFQYVMETAVKLHEKYPNDVIGFDSVGEEDAGHSTLYYLDEYLSLFQNGSSKIPLYLHSVETSWPDDLTASTFKDDLVSSLQNSYESIIFQSKRIGHAKGFLKKPFLRKVLRDKKIAVEICVVSNQILAVDADIRNHYGQILLLEGIPIVLSPDDPGTFGYDNTTVDWYSVYLSWGLNLGDLKQLAINSITYSGMTNKEKKMAVEEKWLPSWKEYVANIKLKACQRNFRYEASQDRRDIIFNRLLPKAGFEGTLVHIYGRNFEASICKTPQCKFGSSFKVTAEYLSNDHVTCGAPKCIGCHVNPTVPIYLSLDGIEFFNTGLNFTYISLHR